MYCLLTVLYSVIKLLENACSNTIHNKNSAEVDIAPAFGEITSACNVGQAKKGHGACFKSVSRTINMQGFILTANTAAKK